MPPLKYNVCYGTRYTSGGEEKTRWTKHGAVIEKDGKFYLKIESFPAPGQDGWFFNLFKPEAKKEKPAPPPPQDDFDDDIPF